MWCDWLIQEIPHGSCTNSSELFYRAHWGTFLGSALLSNSQDSTCHICIRHTQKDIGQSHSWCHPLLEAGSRGDHSSPALVASTPLPLSPPPSVKSQSSRAQQEMCPFPETWHLIRDSTGWTLHQVSQASSQVPFAHQMSFLAKCCPLATWLSAP